jgi:hypothetical protein
VARDAFANVVVELHVEYVEEWVSFELEAERS